MPPFQWQAPPSLDPNGTIAALMLRGPDALANAKIEAARAQAQGMIGSANAWAQGIQGVGNAVQQGIQQATDPARQMQQMQLTKAKQLANGQTQIDAMMKGDNLQPGDEGPHQPNPFLTADGLYDIPKITAALSASGNAHLAPELTKPAENINDSILKHKEIQNTLVQQQAKLADAHTVMIGDMADGVQKLVKTGMPVDQAMDFVSAPAIQRQQMDPKEYASVKQQLLSLPPQQQTAALTQMMDAAAKVGGGETLAKDAERLDRYGRVQASNVVPDAPTTASLDARYLDITTRQKQNQPVSAQDKAWAESYAQQKAATQAPPSLEQQLLAAKASGDPDKVRLILDTIASDANAKRDPVAQAQLEAIRNLTQQGAQERIDNENPQSPKNQQKFEQEYRTVLQRAMSTRSGGIGLEDQKVQQANHLLALMDQNMDPKTGQYNIPQAQYQELALGMARLLSGTGQVGEGMMGKLAQATAEGDLKKVATYLTGTPFNGSTQDVFKMLRDSIQRQGSVAEQNRSGELSYLRGLVPTDLNEDRRKSLEATSLNPLRQSRTIRNTQTGEQKLQVSVDGGKTWQ